MQQLPYAFARRHGAFFDQDAGSGRPVLVHRQSMGSVALAEARRAVGADFDFRVLTDEEFEEALSARFEQHSGAAQQLAEGLEDQFDLSSLADAVPETADLLEQQEDAPIIRLINAILSQAIKDGASDIHIEPYEKRLVVRYRVDGVLREVLEPRRELAPLLVSRVKVMAKLDIAEKRVPQDGRISLRIGGREIDIRVSTMPSSSGERVVMRILDKNSLKLTLDALRMRPEDHAALEENLLKPHGIILVTGPTGSGKSTTLYACLNRLNDRSRNILTVEDPVEYNVEGVGQTQVNVKAGMTFASGLRAMLRQDPDVVMVGEIRDAETAQIAVQASLTGHLVLSTIHTNSAVGVLTRLADMGIEPFLIASSLNAVVAQRLVRRLCPDCKAPHVPTEAERRLLQLEAEDPVSVFRAVGCESCNQQGYRGRMGLYEVLPVSETIRAMVHERAPEDRIVLEARRSHGSLRDDGRVRVLAGLTTVEEVMRVTQEE
jgi:general secretion pathway protein E